MQASLKKLSDILGREHNQYTKLLEVLSAQREAIVSHHPEGLNELLKHQGTIILELKALDAARVALMRKLASQLRLPVGTPTLPQIAEGVEEPFATEYRKFTKLLKHVIQQIEKVHQDNSYLLDHSLDHINGMLRLFTSAHIAQGNSYSQLLQKRPTIAQGKLLCELA